MEPGPPPEKEPSLLRQVWDTLRSYVQGQLLISLILTGVYAAAFQIIEVPLWFLAAILCGPLHLVPMAGALLGALIPISFVAFGGGGWRGVLEVLVVFVLIQALESFVLTPRILGAHLNLKPLVVFLAVLAGGMIFGVVGALVAVPAVAVALIVWQTVKKPET